MKLVITIDTEEDNWGVYRTSGHTLENIQRIPRLQDLFDEFDVRPTYLLTYPVATDDASIRILKAIADSGRCEIGTHCHPWNTPPFEEDTNEKNSMLCNLPAELQFKKIRCLHQTIEKNFGERPVSFRAGRWGYSSEVAHTLFKIGYQVDTSVTAFMDWRNCFGPNFSEIFPKAYRFSSDDIFRETANGHMIEVPASIGFVQTDYNLCRAVFTTLTKKPVNKLRLIGLLYRLNILNMVWLSPENSDSKDMIKLTYSMMRNNYEIINMFFHSPSLKAGNTPYTRTEDDERSFFRTIREFLSFTKDKGIESIKLRDSITVLNK